MKNEDRIVELLAESLRNQDIQGDKLELVLINWSMYVKS